MYSTRAVLPPKLAQNDKVVLTLRLILSAVLGRSRVLVPAALAVMYSMLLYPPVDKPVDLDSTGLSSRDG